MKLKHDINTVIASKKYLNHFVLVFNYKYGSILYEKTRKYFEYIKVLKNINLLY